MTAAVIAINLVWLLPWSVLTIKFLAYAIVSVVAALVPLALLAALIESGRGRTVFKGSSVAAACTLRAHSAGQRAHPDNVRNAMLPCEVG